MNGYGSHTFMWVNAGGERFWVKYHFKTVQGVENFTDAEAKAMTAEDPDFHRADLWESITAGDHPEWRLEMQIMPFEEAADYRFNPFDLTKVWPHSDYPVIPIGRMVLDRNPTNYFAQVAPSPSPSPDRRDLRTFAQVSCPSLCTLKYSSMGGVMTITELAERTGLASSALRFYGRKGCCARSGGVRG